MYNDATWFGLIDYFYTDLSRSSQKTGEVLERTAFKNCDLLLFSSDWAADSAIRDYDVSPNKVKVIPFGANLETKYTDTDIQNLVRKRLVFDRCNLLFVGVDWERKGGAFAVAVTKELRYRGFDARLHIAGIRDTELKLPDYATNYGFISKKTEQGRQKLIELFEEAHFFILPTISEPFGIVFAEASSFGLPSLATKTGGIPTVVRDNVNGMTFPLTDFPNKFADYISNLIVNPKEYETICLSAFEYYRTEINWDVAGERIVDAMQEIIK